MELLILKASKPQPALKDEVSTGEKTKGRKRHIITDVMGNLLAIVVHAANIHNSKAGINPARQAFRGYRTIKRFCGDAGYRKTFEMDVGKELSLGVDISQRIQQGWEILPKRWVVERTFAWLEQFNIERRDNHKT